jgi:SMC interacting uncharacterized protein involved in chromosome segregation
MSQIMVNKNRVDFDLSSDSLKQRAEQPNELSAMVNVFLNEVIRSSLEELKTNMKKELKSCQQDIGQRKMVFSDLLEELKEISAKSSFNNSLPVQLGPSEDRERSGRVPGQDHFPDRTAPRQSSVA